MKIFKAKLLKDLSYISNCKLKRGDVVYIKRNKDNTRSEEHTSELQSHSFISYAVFCLKKKKHIPP